MGCTSKVAALDVGQRPTHPGGTGQDVGWEPTLHGPSSKGAAPNVGWELTSDNCVGLLFAVLRRQDVDWVLWYKCRT
jgi:hypothetical protein